jgi:geranylgeranyl diphosphate synthase type I
MLQISKKSIQAKNKLNDFVETIDPLLENYFNRQIVQSFSTDPKEKALITHILKHIKEHNLRPAKRLRGSFIYYSYKLLGGKQKKEVLKAAMSIELIHTAMLIHDDLMDEDKIRRGKATTHQYYKNYHNSRHFINDSSHYGQSMAVCAGDAALCMGFDILAKCKFEKQRKIEALSRVLTAIKNTAFGQNYDITLEASAKAKEEDVINLHHAKTAIYTYENPLHIGALLAGASTKDLEILSKYAIAGGIAFQLQDDILGLFGNPQKTGKAANSDLKQGKVTLLILKALEKANSKDKNTLKSIWGNKNLTQKDAEVARKIVKDSGSLQYSKDLSIKYAKRAQRAIPLMLKQNWNKRAIAYLDGIAQYMVERDF